MPNKQTMGPLWSEVSKSLGLSPAQMADDDLKQILSGLFSIANGIGAFRTHEGSAHGHGAGVGPVSIEGVFGRTGVGRRLVCRAVPR